MKRDADNLADVQWVAQCADCLRRQWPRADPTSLHEAASELWGDEALRTLTPAHAATVWLTRGLPESALAHSVNMPLAEGEDEGVG